MIKPCKKKILPSTSKHRTIKQASSIYAYKHFDQNFIATPINISTSSFAQILVNNVGLKNYIIGLIRTYVQLTNLFKWVIKIIGQIKVIRQ